MDHHQPAGVARRDRLQRISELHHRVQLQVIKALFSRDERLGVGLEMFQRPFQDRLDRHVRGEGSEQAAGVDLG